MNTGKALLGVFAGLAAGVAIGILFAPSKDSDSKKVISKKGQDLADALNEKIDERFNELVAAIGGKEKKMQVKSEIPNGYKAEVAD